MDYKHPNKKYDSFTVLPFLKSLNEIKDLNEINKISVRCLSKEDAELFLSNFPKSYNGGVQKVNYRKNEKMEFYYQVVFIFNTFFVNKTIGEINESAIIRHKKIVEKLKTLI